VRSSAAALAEAGSVKSTVEAGSAADSLVSPEARLARSLSGYGLFVIVSNALFRRESPRHASGLIMSTINRGRSVEAAVSSMSRDRTRWGRPVPGLT
jgi:hypothetical protein